MTRDDYGLLSMTGMTRDNGGSLGMTGMTRDDWEENG